MLLAYEFAPLLSARPIRRCKVDKGRRDIGGRKEVLI